MIKCSNVWGIVGPCFLMCVWGERGHPCVRRWYIFLAFKFIQRLWGRHYYYNQMWTLQGVDFKICRILKKKTQNLRAWCSGRKLPWPTAPNSCSSPGWRLWETSAVGSWWDWGASGEKSLSVSSASPRQNVGSAVGCQEETRSGRALNTTFARN